MKDAEHYEQWFSTRFGKRADRAEREILGDLLSDIVGVRSLLDVGCGTGHFAGLWRSTGLAAVGIDKDIRMLGFVRAHRPWFPVIRGDAMALPVRDQSFDVVAMITVLEFLEDPIEGLREAARVARKALLLGALNSVSPLAWYRRLRRVRAHRDARFFSPWGLTQLVRMALPGRHVVLTCRTGLGPVPWLDRPSSLPFGAFIGMTVDLL